MLVLQVCQFKDREICNNIEISPAVDNGWRGFQGSGLVWHVAPMVSIDAKTRAVNLTFNWPPTGLFENEMPSVCQPILITN